MGFVLYIPSGDRRISEPSAVSSDNKIPPFEDVFPIENLDFPASHLSFQGCISPPPPYASPFHVLSTTVRPTDLEERYQLPTATTAEAGKATDLAKQPGIFHVF